MADTSHGTGGLTFDKSKRSWPNELNILLALIIIIIIFEIIGQVAPYMNGQSFLFDTKDRFDSIFNEARLKIMILQVATIGIIALGVTQVIITGGIDLSSGPLVAATAMIAMSFAQIAEVNGYPNPKAVFWFLGNGSARSYTGSYWTDIWSNDWYHKRHIRRILQYPSFHSNAWDVFNLSWNRSLVVRRQPNLVSNRKLCMDWVWYDACDLVRNFSNPISMHHEFHGLR